MLRNKRILLIIILAIALFLIPSVCNAADTFATEDGIVAKKVVTSTGGSIELKFSNIALNDEVNYTWAIGRTSNYADIEKWYALGDFSSINKTATITLTPDENKIFKVLKETNTAWIYIKDNTNDNFVVEALKVDLTLPLLRSFKITENPDSSTFRSYHINTVYDIDNLYYKIEKITDEQIIEKYTEAKLKGTSLESISGLATIEDAPQDGWNLVDEKYTAINNYYISKKPTEPGIYYIWVKGKDADSKMVFGYNIFGLDNIAPTVSNIKVVYPSSGTYLTEQIVTIRVNFNETISGTSTPTLKIKFGDSAERSLTNGTIKDNYVEYTYNIQESDKGQLATVSLSGGTLKDAYNNAASLTCPFISGNTIKANVEGTNNNQTDNLDKENNNQTQTPDTTVTLSAIAITKTPTKNTYLEGEKFDKSGMVITAKYSDGSTKQITDYVISPSIELTTKDEKIRIVYSENGVTKTVEQKITVIDKGVNNNDNNTNNDNISKDDSVKDTTVKDDNKLPQTGTTVLTLALISLIAVAIISKVKYGKFKDI